MPTLLLFGKRDRTISHRLTRAPFEPYADDMTLELVRDVGHFIIDERPDLISERALQFFAGDDEQ